MNLKVANLIAVETGILIGLTSWLVYSHFPSAETGTEAGMQESIAAPVRAVAPVNPLAPAPEASDQQPGPAEYSAEREQARMMAERSASLQSYYRAIAQAATTSALENRSTVADSPTYAEVNPEPAALADEYGVPPPTVFYYAPAAVQNVVFANPRRSRNRCQSPLGPGRIGTTTPQCPDRGNPHRNDTRGVSSPNPVPPPPRVTQGLDPRGTVRQSGPIAGQQKREAVPPSRGSGRNPFAVP